MMVVSRALPARLTKAEKKRLASLVVSEVNRWLAMNPVEGTRKAYAKHTASFEIAVQLEEFTSRIGKRLARIGAESDAIEVVNMLNHRADADNHAAGDLFLIVKRFDAELQAWQRKRNYLRAMIKAKPVSVGASLVQDLEALCITAESTPDLALPRLKKVEFSELIKKINKVGSSIGLPKLSVHTLKKRAQRKKGTK
jgi:hypothetical protein